MIVPTSNFLVTNLANEKEKTFYSPSYMTVIACLSHNLFININRECPFSGLKLQKKERLY